MLSIMTRNVWFYMFFYLWYTSEICNAEVSSSCSHSGILKNVNLEGGIPANNYTTVKNVRSMNDCVKQCCKKKNCDLAMLKQNTCYIVSCHGDNACRIVHKKSKTPDAAQIAFITKASSVDEKGKKARHQQKHRFEKSQKSKEKKSKKKVLLLTKNANANRAEKNKFVGRKDAKKAKERISQNHNLTQKTKQLDIGNHKANNSTGKKLISQSTEQTIKNGNTSNDGAQYGYLNNNNHNGTWSSAKVQFTTSNSSPASIQNVPGGNSTTQYPSPTYHYIDMSNKTIKRPNVQASRYAPYRQPQAIRYQTNGNNVTNDTRFAVSNGDNLVTATVTNTLQSGVQVNSNKTNITSLEQKQTDPYYTSERRIKEPLLYNQRVQQDSNTSQNYQPYSSKNFNIQIPKTPTVQLKASPNVRASSFKSASAPISDNMKKVTHDMKNTATKADKESSSTGERSQDMLLGGDIKTSKYGYAQVKLERPDVVANLSSNRLSKNTSLSNVSSDNTNGSLLTKGVDVNHYDSPELPTKYRPSPYNNGMIVHQDNSKVPYGMSSQRNFDSQFQNPYSLYQNKYYETKQLGMNSIENSNGNVTRESPQHSTNQNKYIGYQNGDGISFNAGDLKAAVNQQYVPANSGELIGKDSTKQGKNGPFRSNQSSSQMASSPNKNLSYAQLSAQDAPLRVGYTTTKKLSSSTNNTDNQKNPYRYSTSYSKPTINMNAVQAQSDVNREDDESSGEFENKMAKEDEKSDGDDSPEEKSYQANISTVIGSHKYGYLTDQGTVNSSKPKTLSTETSTMPLSALQNTGYHGNYQYNSNAQYIPVKAPQGSYQQQKAQQKVSVSSSSKVSPVIVNKGIASSTYASQSSQINVPVFNTQQVLPSKLFNYTPSGKGSVRLNGASNQKNPFGYDSSYSKPTVDMNAGQIQSDLTEVKNDFSDELGNKEEKEFGKNGKDGLDTNENHQPTSQGVVPQQYSYSSYQVSTQNKPTLMKTNSTKPLNILQNTASNVYHQGNPYNSNVAANSLLVNSRQGMNALPNTVSGYQYNNNASPHTSASAPQANYYQQQIQQNLKSSFGGYGYKSYNASLVSSFDNKNSSKTPKYTVKPDQSNIDSDGDTEKDENKGSEVTGGSELTKPKKGNQGISQTHNDLQSNEKEKEKEKESESDMDDSENDHEELKSNKVNLQQQPKQKESEEDVETTGSASDGDENGELDSKHENHVLNEVKVVSNKTKASINLADLNELEDDEALEVFKKANPHLFKNRMHHTNSAHTETLKQPDNSDAVNTKLPTDENYSTKKEDSSSGSNDTDQEGMISVDTNGQKLINNSTRRVQGKFAMSSVHQPSNLFWQYQSNEQSKKNVGQLNNSMPNGYRNSNRATNQYGYGLSNKNQTALKMGPKPTFRSKQAFRPVSWTSPMMTSIPHDDSYVLTPGKSKKQTANNHGVSNDTDIDDQGEDGTEASRRSTIPWNSNETTPVIANSTGKITNDSSLHLDVLSKKSFLPFRVQPDEFFNIPFDNSFEEEEANWQPLELPPQLYHFTKPGGRHDFINEDDDNEGVKTREEHQQRNQRKAAMRSHRRRHEGEQMMINTGIKASSSLGKSLTGKDDLENNSEQRAQAHPKYHRTHHSKKHFPGLLESPPTDKQPFRPTDDSWQVPIRSSFSEPDDQSEQNDSNFPESPLAPTSDDAPTMFTTDNEGADHGVMPGQIDAMTSRVGDVNEYADFDHTDGRSDGLDEAAEYNEDLKKTAKSKSIPGLNNKHIIHVMPQQGSSYNFAQEKSPVITVNPKNQQHPAAIMFMAGNKKVTNPANWSEPYKLEGSRNSDSLLEQSKYFVKNTTRDRLQVNTTGSSNDVKRNITLGHNTSTEKENHETTTDLSVDDAAQEIKENQQHEGKQFETSRMENEEERMITNDEIFLNTDSNSRSTKQPTKIKSNGPQISWKTDNGRAIEPISKNDRNGNKTRAASTSAFKSDWKSESSYMEETDDASLSSAFKHGSKKENASENKQQAKHGTHIPWKTDGKEMKPLPKDSDEDINEGNSGDGENEHGDNKNSADQQNGGKSKFADTHETKNLTFAKSKQRTKSRPKDDRGTHIPWKADKNGITPLPNESDKDVNNDSKQKSDKNKDDKETKLSSESTPMFHLFYGGQEQRRANSSISFRNKMALNASANTGKFTKKVKPNETVRKLYHELQKSKNRKEMTHKVFNALKKALVNKLSSLNRAYNVRKLKSYLQSTSLPTRSKTGRKKGSKNVGNSKIFHKNESKQAKIVKDQPDKGARLLLAAKHRKRKQKHKPKKTKYQVRKKQRKPKHTRVRLKYHPFPTWSKATQKKEREDKVKRLPYHNPRKTNKGHKYRDVKYEHPSMVRHFDSQTTVRNDPQMSPPHEYDHGHPMNGHRYGDADYEASHKWSNHDFSQDPGHYGMHDDTADNHENDDSWANRDPNAGTTPQQGPQQNSEPPPTNRRIFDSEGSSLEREKEISNRLSQFSSLASSLTTKLSTLDAAHGMRPNSNQKWKSFINSQEKLEGITQARDDLMDKYLHPDQKCNKGLTVRGATLRGGVLSGEFTSMGMVDTQKSCVDLCCKNKKQCDGAMTIGRECINIKCFDKKQCTIAPVGNLAVYNNALPVVTFIRKPKSASHKRSSISRPFSIREAIRELSESEQDDIQAILANVELYDRSV